MVCEDMRYLMFVFLVFLVASVILARGGNSEEASFYQNYHVSWGGNHFMSLYEGKEVQLSLDKISGAGFQSKMKYGSGYFRMRIKVPGGDASGVVTSFYLSSLGDSHDELDFEFFGDEEGKPYTLQTNVFANGNGNREERLHLWFDPTKNFHDYKILWNQHQVVFYVDNVPIRVYENKSKIGVNYPSKPMYIIASLWQADWAGKTNWSYAPFMANYQAFDISGCQVEGLKSDCASGKYEWNSQKYWKLDPAQQKQYESVRQKLTYDYCTDKKRYPTPPLECPK